MTITEQQFRTSLQGIQSRYIKLELLNYQFQTVDELSGVSTSGSISINANADIRRTASVTLIVKDSSFEVEVGSKIWLDKYIRIYVGTMSLKTGEIEYTNCGMYIIDAPNYKYNPDTNTLSLSLLDLMAKLTGVRNGYLKGIPVILKAGENIRKAIIDTLALGGFTKYVVEEAPSPGTIPNDLEFSQGSTVYDLLSGLRDIYPDFEMFFDVDGTFYYKPIPTGEGDPVVIDDTLWDKLVIDEDLKVDFQNVKNSIEVYGRIHDPAHFSTSTSVSGVNISLTIADVSSYSTNLIYGFTLTDNTGITAPYLKINSLTNYPIKNDDGTSAVIKAETGEVYYCVQFVGTHWRWLGHLQAYAESNDNFEGSPFSIDKVGIIRLPLYDGEYANCITDELCKKRSDLELWKHTQLQDTVTLTTVPIPWGDVNILTEYTLKRNGIKKKYLSKSINFGLAVADTMTWTLMSYYPEGGVYGKQKT